MSKTSHRLCFEIRRKTILRFAFTEVYCSCMKLIILYKNVHKEIINLGCILIFFKLKIAKIFHETVIVYDIIIKISITK